MRALCVIAVALVAVVAATGAESSLAPRPCLPAQLRATVSLKHVGGRVQGTTTIANVGLRCGLRLASVGVHDADGWSMFPLRRPQTVLGHGRRVRATLAWRNWCQLRPAQLVFTLAPRKGRFALPYHLVPQCASPGRPTRIVVGPLRLLRG